jgi:hypothetical protein
MKCNSHLDLVHKTILLEYVPKYNLILVFLAGFVRYQKYQVPTILCKAHVSSYRTTRKAGILVAIMGALGFLYGFSEYSRSLMIFAGIVAAAGILIVIFAGRTLSIDKRDDFRIWLKGVNEQYLSMLPQWPARR